jgi:hypothetical protein
VVNSYDSLILYNTNGPFSVVAPSMELQPGPPLVFLGEIDNMKENGRDYVEDIKEKKKRRERNKERRKCLRVFTREEIEREHAIVSCVVVCV